MSENKVSVPLTQPCAETAKGQQTSCHRRWCEIQSRQSIAMALSLWHPVDDEQRRLLRQRLLAATEEWELVHPLRAATRGEVAFHEAGHFVVSEAIGLRAATAEVRSFACGLTGWDGSATAEGRLRWFGLSRHTRYTVNEVRSEAIFNLAGPAAGAIHGRGDFNGSPGEILSVCMAAAWLGQEEGTGTRRALIGLLERVTRLVRGHRDDIEAIAERLMERNRIDRCQSAITEVLAAVVARPLDSLPAPTSEQYAELFMFLDQPPVDLNALMKEVMR